MALLRYCLETLRAHELEVTALKSTSAAIKSRAPRANDHGAIESTGIVPRLASISPAANSVPRVIDWNNA